MNNLQWLINCIESCETFEHLFFCEKLIWLAEKFYRINKMEMLKLIGTLDDIEKRLILKSHGKLQKISKEDLEDK